MPTRHLKHLVPPLRFADTAIADAINDKLGPDIPPENSPPGRSLAEMQPETLALVLVAIDGLRLQLQQLLITRQMRTEKHNETAAMLGRLITAGNQLRRYLAALDAA